jgi:hypothetical protein
MKGLYRINLAMYLLICDCCLSDQGRFGLFDYFWDLVGFRLPGTSEASVSDLFFSASFSAFKVAKVPRSPLSQV